MKSGGVGRPDRTRTMRPARPTPRTAPEFSTAIVQIIADSLPSPLSTRCRELLPQILDEWRRNELQRHLSMESDEIRRDRSKKMNVVKSKAGQLLQALDAVDEHGRREIVVQIISMR